MRKVRSKVLLALVALTIAGTAEACRLRMFPAERLAFGYKRADIAAVALVRISASRYTSPPVADAHPWQASAAVDRILTGVLYVDKVTFNRGGGSSACDDGHPAPKPGERWVVYFWKRGERDLVVYESYPAEVAFAADPHLRP